MPSVLAGLVGQDGRAEAGMRECDRGRLGMDEARVRVETGSLGQTKPYHTHSLLTLAVALCCFFRKSPPQRSS